MNKYKLLSIFFFFLLIINIGYTSGKTVTDSLTTKTLYVDDDAPPGWYDETHFKTIMDAINSSDNGDAVFVYNGTYSEEVRINHSISIVGENKYNTIIDGLNIVSDELTTGFLVSSDNVEIYGFTIQNFNYSGIEAGFNNSNISDNIIKDCPSIGMMIGGARNSIINNNISTGGTGILLGSKDTKIFGNVITAREGVFADESSGNNITSNEIKGCDRGLIFYNSKNNLIKRNNLEGNNDNIFLALSCRNKFYENNLLGFGDHQVVLKGWSFLNKWRGNYWDNQIIHFLPKIVLGRFGILPIPWFNVDWHPARKPYDI